MSQKNHLVDENLKRYSMIFDQSEFERRCEWGEQGVDKLAPISDVVVIVDVLSFSTWEDGSLRPAFEDLIGAGAILSYLGGRLSPEAKSAVAVFRSLKDNLLTALRECSSGKELIARGFATDIELAAAINISRCVPLFTHNAYIKQETSR